MADKKLKLIIYIVGFVVVIAVATALYNFVLKNYTPEIAENDLATSKETAPDFTVYDKNGREVELSDYKGKPIVINFWATWCEPCKVELPAFESACRKYDDEVEFLMVNINSGDTEPVKSFIKENGYTFPNYFDRDNSAASAYSVSAIPVTVFIDKDGVLRGKQIGVMNKQVLFEYIDALIGG